MLLTADLQLSVSNQSSALRVQGGRHNGLPGSQGFGRKYDQEVSIRQYLLSTRIFNLSQFNF